MFGIPARSVQTHVALTLRLPIRFPQHLQGSFVRVQKGFCQQLRVKTSTYGQQPRFRSPDEPVGHGLAGQRYVGTPKFLLHMIQRRIHHEFLRHDVSDGFRCRNAAPDHRFVILYRYNGRRGAILITVFAGITVNMGLYNNEFRRHDFQPPHDLFADFRYLLSAFRTSLSLLWQAFLYDLNLNVLRQFFLRNDALFSRVRFHLRQIGFRCDRRRGAVVSFRLH